jgi:hypothetical protein
MSNRPVVALGGSRGLGAAFAAPVGSVCSSLSASGASLAVGCCKGFDALVLSWALSPVPVGAVRCFAAFSNNSDGACGLSAVSAVSRFAARGGPVSWLAGGPASAPLARRLSARTRAVVASAVASARFCPVPASPSPGSCPGAVVFFGSPSSRGSFLAASVAATANLPVWAFACGFCPSQLPALEQGGCWSACPALGVWSSAFVWVPPLSLF